MKKKNIVICIVFVLIILIFATASLILKKNSSGIPNDYIAVFHGGAGEITYSTYIYKVDNGKENYGFKYINTTNTTKSWGSPKWKTKITKRGEFDWTDGAFEVAEKNSAYDYVQLPNSEEIYSIEEFRSIFMKN
jgi:hypothetical protein